MEESKTGKVFLIPSLMGDVAPLEVLPMAVRKALDLSMHFVVENEKSARAFIKKVFPQKAQNKIHIQVLNKFTDPTEVTNFLAPCRDGHNIAVISEAGAPGIADPGSEIVALAHQENIRVVPLVGPSSIQLAMMASGMNGQNFAFNGYLPIDKDERKKEIKALEKKSAKTGQAQIFMETPYRNEKLFQQLLKHCQPSTRLCIAREITSQNEWIKTMPVGEWQNVGNVDLEKKPAIFIMEA